ncbi:hypothetical protein JOF56_003141 [Kibdelosporangium banguiense]|uniref:Uncharacterized protein n=1 Tax=Kibdelosporangium banguiense TaxID=1365924 RepID=A0ABS4TEB5_9PSEU|nr:hypothetical protein [Kibdelosporangium banguiense]MBP2322756.1 hypothetical protein [Kibdelosporangium banguiense]
MALKQELRTWHRPLLVLTALMAATLLLSVGGLLFDDRVLRGEPLWLKPFKFSVSIGVYALTLAWLISLLGKGRKVVWWMGTISAAMLILEMIALVTQVFRVQPSHFNNAPGFDSLVFRMMGVAIVVMWLSNLVVALIVLRQRFVGAPMLWAIRFGLVLALIGMAVAFMMPQPTPEQLELLRNDVQPALIGGHSVGVPDGGPGMPITHWSTTGGDLRIPHFVGIHAMQALPLLAFFFGRRFGGRSELTRTRLIFVATFAYAGLLALTIWQALRGQPLIHPDGLTLGVFGLLVAMTAVLTTSVLRTKEKTLV